MVTSQSRFRKGTVLTASALIGSLFAAACVAPQHSSLEETATSSPSVTYKYNTDDELIRANQRAVSYCNEYNFVPQASNFSKDPDGRNVVVFDCVVPTQIVQANTQFSQDMLHNYRNDQELLVLSREAQLYCMNNRNQQAFSNIQANMDGSRSVSFRCSQ